MQQKSQFKGGRNSRPQQSSGSGPRNNPRRGGNRSGGGRSKFGKQNVHFSRYVNRATDRPEPEVYQPKNTFADFNLNPHTAQSLEKLGFTNPSAIQDEAIPLLLEGKDVLGLANTGTGKTAAFLLPIIEKLTANREFLSVLIMAPTRELAQQIDEEFRRFSVGQKFYSTLCVGGANIDRQIREISRRPHVVIGTPGRLKDLMKRKVLKLDNVNTFVLDEADRMLDMGFVNDIREIASKLPLERQTLCFSATITPAIKTIIDTMMNNPETVAVRTSETSEHIDQDVVHANDKNHKLELLEAMLARDEFSKVLVFGETKFGVQRLSDRLEKSGIASAAIHGNKSQSQRQRALKAFKDERVNVLIATDVAARGLDIPNVSHVINFDTPQTYDDYIHRIGRTGRSGSKGTALTFIEK